MKWKARPSIRTRLGLERLEDRYALAGNVSAALSAAGDLTVRGDVLENDIRIFADGEGHVVVRGNDTRVNGQTADAVFDLPTGGLRNMSLRMSRAFVASPQEIAERGPFGADHVELADLVLSGSLSLRADHAGVITATGLDVDGGTSLAFGSGVSRVEDGQRVGCDIRIEDSELGIRETAKGPVLSDVSVKTARSNDRIAIVGTEIGHDLSVNSGVANDVIYLGSEAEGGTRVGGNLKVLAGRGRDRVELSGLNVAGKTTLEAGADSDDVRLGDAGGDALTSFDGDVSVNLGGGQHDSFAVLGELTRLLFLTASNTTFDADLDIRGGSGVDCALLQGAFLAGNVQISTGSGDDFLAAADLAIRGSLTANTGRGNDVLALAVAPDDSGSVTIGGRTSIDSGAGNDIVAAQDTTFSDDVRIIAGSANDTVSARSSSFQNALFADGGTGLNQGLFEDNTFPLFGPDPVIRNLPEPADPNAALAAMFSEITSRFQECFPEFVQ